MTRFAWQERESRDLGQQGIAPDGEGNHKLSGGWRFREGERGQDRECLQWNEASSEAAQGDPVVWGEVRNRLHSWAGGDVESMCGLKNSGPSPVLDREACGSLGGEAHSLLPGEVPGQHAHSIQSGLQIREED